MSRTITQITAPNTFQDWLDTTNDMALAFADVVTIGDDETNAGNVIISGNITVSGENSLITNKIEDTQSAQRIEIETLDLGLSVDNIWLGDFNDSFKLSITESVLL